MLIRYSLLYFYLCLFLLISPVILCQSNNSLHGKSNFKFNEKSVLIGRNNPQYYIQNYQVPYNPVKNFLPQTKAESGPELLLDSIVEIKSDGYYDEIRRWYYYYNNFNHLDSLSLYFFDEYGRFKHIVEKGTYNSSGQLTRFMRRQMDPYRTYLLDSTMIDYLVEEYNYQDDNLIKKTTTTIEYQGLRVIEENFYYNNDGKLIIDSIFYNGNFGNYYEYSYNTENELEYLMRCYSNEYDIQKFTYSETDTSRLITEKRVYYRYRPEKPVLDTISVWQGEKYFYETYDILGRRTSLVMEEYGAYAANGKVYKAEFTWTDFNDLLHASYFDWNGNSESGIWKEVLRIDNTYDEHGNLLVYEKTFFDTRTEFWENEDIKNYYYSLMPNGLPSNMTRSESLVIFPNPAENVINIKLPVNEDSYFTIYNLYGVVVAGGKLEDQAIVISQFKPGIYLVEISNGQSLYSGKFVKF